MELVVSTLYLAMINSDMDEGRGPYRTNGAFFTREQAKRYADRHEPYGHTGQFNRVEEITLFASADDALLLDDAMERRAILNKLTDREKRLLGLESGDE